MRLSIKLKAFRSDLFPANYNYPFTAVVYNILKLGSKEFSNFLHEHGFKANGKRFKLFTFAVKFKEYKHEYDSLRLTSPYLTLYVSSPLNSEFIKNFVIGTIEKQIIKIRYDGYFTTLEIIQMETIPDPVFTGKMKFKLLSPIILSTVKENEGSKKQYYFRYYDDIDEINRVFVQNLERKYEAIHNIQYSGQGVIIKWDNDYINRISDEKKITRLIRIKPADGPEIFYKGNLLPFYLEGDKELIELGYNAGYGEKNSMGFGMAEAVH